MKHPYLKDNPDRCCREWASRGGDTCYCEKPVGHEGEHVCVCGESFACICAHGPDATR